MTNDKEILAQYREELEIKINDIFTWALCEAAVTEMTKTVRDNDTNKMSINQLYSLFRLQIIPERNKFIAESIFWYHSGTERNCRGRVDKNITNRKFANFTTFTPAELIASKFSSLIERSTGNYELKKKFRNSNMTIETITDIISEYMYDRVNDSNSSNGGRDIKHVQERPQKRSWSEKHSYDKHKRRPKHQRKNI